MKNLARFGNRRPRRRPALHNGAPMGKREISVIVGIDPSRKFWPQVSGGSQLSFGSWSAGRQRGSVGHTLPGRRPQAREVVGQCQPFGQVESKAADVGDDTGQECWSGGGGRVPVRALARSERRPVRYVTGGCSPPYWMYSGDSTMRRGAARWASGSRQTLRNNP